MMTLPDRMTLLELLEHRVSIPVLDEPAPSETVLEHAMKAAVRAPDHGQLRPWRFLRVDGEARVRLGNLLAQAALTDNSLLAEEELDRFRKMPLRAPMLIIGIARLQEHPKVPLNEQRISAGAAVMNIMLSLRAQGFGSMWRTGAPAYHPVVKAGLGLAESEEIIAFLYVGTPAGKIKSVPALNGNDFLQSWPS